MRHPEVRTEAISTLEALLAREEDWRGVEALDSSSTVFSTWEWNQAAALHLLEPTTRLCAIIVSDRGEAIGLAPFGFRSWHRLRTLAFIGTGLRDYSRADYQDVLAADGCGDVVVEQVCAYLQGVTSGWDMLWLQELPPESQTPTLLRHQAMKRGWILEESDGTDVHRLDLPESWDQYRATLSPNTREAIERKARKLTKETGARLRRVEQRRDLPQAMGELFALHASRWNAVGRPGIFASDRSQAFHRELAGSLFAAGMLDLALLETADGAIGARYSFSHKGQHYFYANGYQSAADWARYSLGLVLDGLAIRAAIEAGFEREDFLRGEAHYKARYATRARLNREVRVFHSRGAYARYRVISSLRAAARRARDTLRGLRSGSRNANG